MNKKIARIERALDALEPLEANCTLCPRACRVDRRKDRSGICQSGSAAGVSAALLHYGEEPVLSGHHDCAAEAKPGGGRPRGSGTVFFTGCNLKCLFCQNYQISWHAQGPIVDDKELAALMLGLQDQGAYNINLVSPTHLILPILRALKIACSKGLAIPLVYNSNGYEKIEVVEKLAGIVDIYLPDLKYFSSRVSQKYSGAGDYFENAGLAIQEMFVQQPELVLDEQDTARRGLIIRHLILPGQTDDSLAILDWIAKNLPLTISLSLMSQYRPSFRAPDDIRRPLSGEEYRAVVSRARQLGFENLFLQPELFGPDDHLVPDFNRAEPFRWKK
ncbi:MAG: radical SAM protein [Candidatus Aminicenantales bacterium]